MSGHAEGMAVLVQGCLGSGKTLFSVEYMLRHLAFGGTVVTNVAIQDQHLETIAKRLRDRWHVIFQPARLRLIKSDSIRSFHDYAVRGTANRAVLMVLDEAAMDLNARDWKKREDMAFHAVVLARKLRIMLWFIAQDQDDMDSQIRRKFNKCWQCRSLSNLWEREDGSQFGIPLFIRVAYSDKLGGKGVEKKTRLGWQIRWGSPAFGCFDSHGLHGANAKVFEALETAPDDLLVRIPRDYTTHAAIAGTLLTML